MVIPAKHDTFCPSFGFINHVYCYTQYNKPDLQMKKKDIKVNSKLYKQLKMYTYLTFPIST